MRLISWYLPIYLVKLPLLGHTYFILTLPQSITSTALRKDTVDDCQVIHQKEKMLMGPSSTYLLIDMVHHLNYESFVPTKIEDQPKTTVFASQTGNGSTVACRKV